ncbi:MAG: N-glycosylase/DNA lyase [Candidatus Altiarchaeales archaeon]|nr:N-glycosylase/DNA lyase [Candidatus Altiarchaeota archaeon]MCG2782847.1 N-glycosylase/DNA lyase [Candidatus Altiarchaeales archaeon]MBU4266973.1 N-glycosylase/DNA lyase [Candidatus Altiarchaeota archaeon]MBU4342131.1 N-glycosylase/DNA lyase [Candidatus Altiarchaeota archaeon]MBU4406394.1 N-glycosylase/DNA lyase [Candidatus Altiarchaeota archaeon]
MDNLKRPYSERKTEIGGRISEFEAVGKGPDDRIFLELTFCLCTPQSKAKACWEAVSKLAGKGILRRGSRAEIRKGLIGVRFANNKSDYIVEARGNFQEIIKFRELNNPLEMREFLVENVKGLGWKEASHFLRNVGYGKDIAILDRHILRNLLRFKVILEIPRSISKRRYIEIENKMKKFSQNIGIPLQELDLLFWSLETEEVFK